MRKLCLAAIVAALVGCGAVSALDEVDNSPSLETAHSALSPSYWYQSPSPAPVRDTFRATYNCGGQVWHLRQGIRQLFYYVTTWADALMAPSDPLPANENAAYVVCDNSIPMQSAATYLASTSYQTCRFYARAVSSPWPWATFSAYVYILPGYVQYEPALGPTPQYPNGRWWLELMGPTNANQIGTGSGLLQCLSQDNKIIFSPIN